MTNEEIEELREQWEREREEAEAGLKRNRDDLISEKRAERAKRLEAERERDEAKAELERIRGDRRGEADDRIDQLETEKARLARQLERERVDSVARTAIASARGDSELLLPHVRDHLRLVERDGKRTVLVVDPETGQELMMDNELDITAKKPVTVSDFVDSLREKFPKAFGASTANGAGIPSAETETGPRVVRGDTGNDFFTEHLQEIAEGKIRFNAVEGGIGDVWG